MSVRMAYTVYASAFAKTDRKNIANHLARYSLNAPQKFRIELKKYIEIIRRTPNIFSTYHSNPEYRHVVLYGAYVMFYTVDESEKTVSIHRILHGSQDIANVLS